MKALVSILTCAYNAERTIAQTLESAIAQTWPRKEIIVVNDGSTDATFDIALKFASNTVRVLSQDNAGAPSARNKALSLCQGDYIQWLDADDLLSPNKIEQQMKLVEQGADRKALMSCGWAYFLHRVSRARFLPSSLWRDLEPVEWIVHKWEGNDHMQTATWLVSRELTDAVGPWDARLISDDDGEYFCRVILASSGVRFASGAKVFYRVTDSGRWSHIGRSSKKIEAQFLAMKLQIGYLLEHTNNARTRAACVNYLKTWLPTFYPDRPDIVNEARALAQTFGADFVLPRTSWKYAWIEKLFGPHVRKEAQIRYNEAKSSLLRAWDKMMYQFERNGSVPS